MIDLITVVFQRSTSALVVYGLSFITAAVWSMHLLLPCAIGAQTPSPSSLATITTDTGAFALGDRDFTRYSTPGWCRAAAIQTGDVLRASLTAQTTLDTLEDQQLDTVGAQGVVSIAKTCGARFTVAGTSAKELPMFFDLALLEQNDTLARTILARQVALAATTAVRDSLLLAADSAALGAAPARVALAESIVADLDILGPSSQIARLRGHVELLGFWVYSAHTDRARQEATQIIELAHLETARARTDLMVRTAVSEALLAAYRARMALAFFAHPDSLPGIARQAQHEQWLSSALGDTAFSHWPVDSVVAKLAPVDTSGETDRAIGHPTPRLRADYWYPVASGADNAITGDTMQPARGRVSIFVLANLDDLACIEHNAGECFAPVAARVRRWLKQDSAAGLSVTIVAQTWEDNNLFGRLTPAKEAERLRWFIQDYWHLPVTVAVQVPGFTALPQPDGRRAIAQETQIAEWAKHGGNGETGEVFLTGRDGKLLAITADIVNTSDPVGQKDAAEQFDALTRWALSQGGSRQP